jgi:hypothetical protein
MKRPPPIDPTANVLSLVAAAIKRQDDLREQAEKYRDKLAEAESRRVDANALAESRRIDALLQDARNAVALATARAEGTATALAERVDAAAKALAQGSGRDIGMSLGAKVVIGFVSLFVALLSLAGAGVTIWAVLHR